MTNEEELVIQKAMVCTMIRFLRRAKKKGYSIEQMITSLKENLSYLEKLEFKTQKTPQAIYSDYLERLFKSVKLIEAGLIDGEIDNSDLDRIKGKLDSLSKALKSISIPTKQ